MKGVRQMPEILTHAGSELRILKNADGTVTAQIGTQAAKFATFQEAVEWVCAVRDGAIERGEN